MKDVKKLFSIIDDEKVDAVLVLSEKNRLYFTNFASTFGYLILTRSKMVFITDFRYAEMAEGLKDDGIEVLTGYGAELSNILISTLDQLNVGELGYEDNEVTVSEYNKFAKLLVGKHLIGVGQSINKMREIKTDEELDYIKKAQQATDKAFIKILDYIKVGMTEKQVAVELEHQLRVCGGDGLAFESIVASGKNASKPHAHPSDKKIESGDVLTMDFGASYHGYCSDMTRTIFVGKPSEEILDVYRTVLQTQLKALALIKAGAVCNEIDKVAREYVVSKGYPDFKHGLGHSVGIDIHESPAFNTVCEDKLQENMLMTVEPGIYIADFGGVRIEDLVIVTKNGVNNLTTSNKDIIII